MDAIGIRRFNAAGEVVAVRQFVGLFTSAAYSRNLHSIPLLRQKVKRTIERAGFAPESHDGKALLHILETFPRDELFQNIEDELYDTAIGILNLQERQRIALFVRRDPLERFVSCLVFVPGERYDTRLRQSFAAILEEAFAGTVTDFYTQFDGSVLARVQFIIHVTRGAVPPVNVARLEQLLVDAGRTWSNLVEEAAAEAFGEIPARARLRRLKPFPIAYQARTEPAQAIADLERIEAVLAGSPIEASLHPRADRQGSAFSQSYMEETLARHAPIARRLVQLFERRFDPTRDISASLDQIAEVQAIDHALDRVESLDEDRILRAYLTLILKSVRTNYYQT